MNSTPDMLIRPARSDELVVASELCLRSKAYWGYDEAFMAACRDELTLAKRDLVESDIAIAERGGVMLGVAQVCFEDGEPDIEKLFIDPDVIGHGIGRALFEWCTNRAKAKGASAITVTADPYAVPFYEKMGFRRIGEQESGSITGRVLPVFRLEL